MMKKLLKVLPVVLAFTMILGMGLALAEQAADPTPAPTAQESAKPDKAAKSDKKGSGFGFGKDKDEEKGTRQERLQEFKKLTKQLRERIQEKRGEIKEAQRANRSLTQQIRARLEQLKEDGLENLTPEQIETIKAAGLTLRQKAGNAGSVVKANKGMWQQFRAALKAGNYDEAAGIVEQMRSNYETVLGKLCDTGDALAALLASLQ